MLSGLFSGFMVDTWLEASVMAVVAGVVGFFVVFRGSTFAAHAIPQGAFTGAAGAALVGANTLVGVGLFSLLGAVSIARWGRRGRRRRGDGARPGDLARSRLAFPQHEH